MTRYGNHIGVLFESEFRTASSIQFIVQQTPRRSSENPVFKVAQCALSDYLCLVFDDTCGQVVTTDIYHFDIRFGNGCTGGNVAYQPDNFGFSVRQAIDQRCDAETDRKCDDNANDPDYRAVSDRMGCVCFFCFMCLSFLKLFLDGCFCSQMQIIRAMC